MKKLTPEQISAYLGEYGKNVMSPLVGKITWGIISETASNANNHLITANDCSALSRILTPAAAALDSSYRSTDVLNDQILPAVRLATLETDYWQLDGKYSLPEENEDGTITNRGEIGWVSDTLCGADKVFAQGSEPRLLIQFDQPNTTVNLTGLMIQFFAYRNEYPENLDVIITRRRESESRIYYIYSAAAASYSLELQFNNATITDADGGTVTEDFSNGITDISQIELKINRWSVAQRRARIDEIEFGMYKFYNNDTLVSVDETRVMNTVSCELPISTFAFTVLDNDRLFDSENPNSLTQFLTRRQPVKVEWTQPTDFGPVVIPGGEYYLKEWNSSDSRREYKLVAEDLIGFTEEPYYKGQYPFYRENGEGYEKTVTAVIEELFNELFPSSSGLSGKLDVSEVPQDLLLEAPLPLKLNNNQCTYKDCFMMLAQIAGCVITTDDEGKIVFKKLIQNYYPGCNANTPLPDEYKIPMSVVFDQPPQSILKSPLKEVKVNYYGYTLSTSRKTELHKWKFIPSEEQIGKKITFELNKPGSISEIYNEGIPCTAYFERVDSTFMTTIKYLGGDISGGVTMPDDGFELIIEGQELLSPCGIYSKVISENTSGEVVTIDCPLCATYEQAQTLAENFISETRMRDTFELEIKRNLLFECGDVLELEKPVWGSEITAKVPCRLSENKKSLTKVRQGVKLRKIDLNKTV